MELPERELGLRLVKRGYVMSRSGENGHTPLVARNIALVPLESEGRADIAANRIREAIRLGILSEGDQLPSEAELSVELSVATKTLRDALAILRDEGVIETRRGRNGGSFVTSNARRSSKSDALSRLSKMSVVELFDLESEYRAISGVTASLAAQRADDEDLVRIRTHIDRLAAAEHVNTMLINDSRFHIEVSVSSQSERLLRREIQLQAEALDLLWAFDSTGFQSRSVLEHQAILDAISRQDDVLARSLAEEHVHEAFVAIIQQRIGARKRVTST